MRSATTPPEGLPHRRHCLDLRIRWFDLGQGIHDQVHDSLVRLDPSAGPEQGGRADHQPVLGGHWRRGDQVERADLVLDQQEDRAERGLRPLFCLLYTSDAADE